MYGVITKLIFVIVLLEYSVCECKPRNNDQGTHLVPSLTSEPVNPRGTALRPINSTFGDLFRKIPSSGVKKFNVTDSKNESLVTPYNIIFARKQCKMGEILDDNDECRQEE